MKVYYLAIKCQRSPFTVHLSIANALPHIVIPRRHLHKNPIARCTATALPAQLGGTDPCNSLLLATAALFSGFFKPVPEAAWIPVKKIRKTQSNVKQIRELVDVILEEACPFKNKLSE
ncbi:UNVERIFIED_CONTAM: hypothetical protein Slati_1574700 [Sesamum latifolium]|uniref:Uncharacterized protein n=1 Tax=Sesamum latifolium TaxID=2727402 RepID=A0AAW2X8M1_9LAMI